MVINHLLTGMVLQVHPSVQTTKNHGPFHLCVSPPPVTKNMAIFQAKKQAPTCDHF